MFYGGRVATLSVVLFLSYVIISEVRTNRGALVAITLGSTAVVFVWYLLSVLSPDIFQNRIDGLAQAISVASANQSGVVVDASVLSRLSQFSAITERVQAIDYVLGLGLVSTQWAGGFDAIFGRFHPADLGIYGVITMYGVLGIFSMTLIHWILAPTIVRVSKVFVGVLIFLLIKTVLWGLAFFQVPFVLVLWLIMVNQVRSEDSRLTG